MKVLVLCAILAIPQGGIGTYVPSGAQQGRLELKHKKMEMAKYRLKQAETGYARAMSALNMEGSNVMEENHWKGVVFDPETLRFKRAK